MPNPANSTTAQPQMPRVVPVELSLALSDMRSLVEKIGPSSHPAAIIARLALTEIRLVYGSFSGAVGADERAEAYLRTLGLMPPEITNTGAKDRALTPKKAKKFRNEMAAHGFPIT